MTTINNDLKGVDNIGDTLLMNELENNMKTWLDWGLLRIGGWFDVVVPTTTAYGADMSTLRAVKDHSYTDGQVWEGARKDWVWESGVDYVDATGTTHNPAPVSNLTVDSVSSAAGHHINYPLGRVIFDTAISTTAAVQADYSYRYVQVYRANDAPWWQELQYRSFRADDAMFSQSDTGDWSVGGQHRIQMPCIIIDAVPRSDSRGYQLGDGGYWVHQDVLAGVLAESKADRNRLVDILRGQFDKVIWLFNSDEVADASDFPLDHRGEIVDSAKNYPFLVNETGHRWIQCRFTDTSTSNIENLHSNLYAGIVRLTCEVLLDD